MGRPAKGYSMNIILTIIMYCMWAVTILAVLAATFTNFAYLDLNIIAIVLLVFTIINSYFTVSSGKRKQPDNK